MVNKLIYNGITYEAEIVSGYSGLDMQHAMVGETLSVDELTVRVLTGDLPERVLCSDQTDNDFIMTSDGYVLCCRSGAAHPVFAANGAGLYCFNDTLIGKYYLNELHQVGQNEWEMIFYSAIRLLDRSKHFGGLYSGETVGTVLASIMGEVSYTVDSDIAAIQVYQYLPYASRRNNLQFLLMAHGLAVRNNSDGSLRVTALSDTVTGTFAESRVFIGASVNDETPCTAVQVTEHNFIPTTEAEALYENTSITSETITFSAPHHDYVITNGTITASGVNYVTFTGAGAVTITGKKYIHIERIITVGTTPTGADSDVVKTVTGNTLIGPNNAADVAQNLYDFLAVAQSIKAEVIFSSERPGDVVYIVHPYTREVVKACAKNMDIDMGVSELRANSKFLVGYTPPSPIAGFEHYAVLTGAGNWTVPAGTTKIRAIVVGAGDGASGGAGGNGGSLVTTVSNANVGGDGGDAGSGSTILEMNIAVTPASLIPFACGVKGTGGIKGTGGQGYNYIVGQTGTPGATGAVGGETVFGGYSSSLGRAFPDGYVEPKTGLTFGANGINGVNGGHGGTFAQSISDAEDVTFGGVTYTGGEHGENILNMYNGQTGWGGEGGGAAVGGNGANGQIPTWYNSQPIHGNAGVGASAIDGLDATPYGSGGNGGHGGGGGGHAVRSTLYGSPWLNGQNGNGGNGGDGGDGGDGCIVVYY